MKRRKRRAARARTASFPAFAFALLLIGAVALFASRALRDVPAPSRSAHAHRSGHAATLAATEPSPSAHDAAATLAPAATPGAAATPAPAATPAAPATPAAASAAPNGAKLALIIDDCGQWRDTERGFVALRVPLTLSVLPHVRYGAQIAREANAAGKGVMLHLPMEPRSGANPGPGEISTAMDDAAIATQVGADLDEVPLATGVNNHEGSGATADDRVMRDVAAVLAARRVFFIDSRTTAKTVAERDVGAAGVPTARRDVFLDDVDDRAAVEAQLRRAAEIARDRGTAIAIGHPRAATLAAVRSLVPVLQAAGIEFVLAADLVRR